MQSETIVIAVDGRGGSGKGTVADKLAAYFGFTRLDTGLIYRALTRQIIDLYGSQWVERDAVFRAKMFEPEMLQDDRLYEEAVNIHVAHVAKIPRVREIMRDFQRGFPTAPGSVVDGRDIGTVIFPDAQVKFFIDAKPEERALRIHERHVKKGEPSVYEEVLLNLRRRDKQDAERQDSPAKAAEDAHLIDNTRYGADLTFRRCLDICLRKIGTPAPA